ncbi:type II toxin-antitoxin system HicA family toxin [Candidatus Peregrinibacteria bacterium]|nr:type II toxin-antitoxin system HicA family toxin [Candidatus Peregrinibacteria bacterium]
MPRVSGKELARLLHSLGYELDRIRGSHHIFRHPDMDRIVVPIHAKRPIAIGTLQGIIKKQLKWTVEEFIEALHCQ